MNDQEMLKLVDQIRETAFAGHRFFGSGHFEKIYENALVNRLTKAGIAVEHQVPIMVRDEEETIVGEYVADLVVDRELIIELKACECLTQGHECQIMGYFRVTKMRHGLLINFGSRKFEIKKFIL